MVPRVSICLYGPVKTRKTTQALAAVPDLSRAYFVTTEPGALDVWMDPELNPHRDRAGRCVQPPNVAVCKGGVSEYSGIIQQVAAYADKGAVDWLVIDEPTTVTKRELGFIVKHDKISDTEWGAAYKELTYRARIALMPMLTTRASIIVTAHERKHNPKFGRIGAPQFPGALAEEFCGYFSMGLRTVARAAVGAVGAQGPAGMIGASGMPPGAPPGASLGMPPGASPWSLGASPAPSAGNGVLREYVFVCNEQDATYYTWDRYKVFKQPEEPMDLRSIVARVVAKGSVG